MAYTASTDYKALQNTLKAQMDAETDAVKKAALQSQYDAAGQSRTEKLASDLTTYGKYANASELDSAAGLMAQNQIGTGYETQKANLNTSYDNAKQNANNNALSRGMARSSFVQDRQANLDSDRATALAGVDASKVLALQNAKANILGDYRTNTANALANEKSEFANTIGAYYNDYQAEVNKVQNDNDTSNDWKIPYLQQARNQKLLAQQEAAAKAAKTSSGGGGSGTGDGGGVSFGTTAAEALANINNWTSAGGQSLAQIAATLLNQYKSGAIDASEYATYKSIIDTHRVK